MFNFSSKKRQNKAQDMKEKDAIKAFLGDDTEFTGLLTFEGTVRIDGSFEGEIKTEDNLIIGENATVKAEITVGTLMVQGKIEGNIIASKKLHVTSKGRVIGNVVSPALHIEEGAVLEGNVSMISRDKKTDSKLSSLSYGKQESRNAVKAGEKPITAEELH